MEYFHNMFQSSIQDAVSFKKVGAKLIARKLTKHGITLTQEQLEKIEISLENAKDDSLTFHIDDLDVEMGESNNLVIELNESADEIDELVKDIISKVSDALPNIISETADAVLQHLKFDAARMLEEHEEDREKFQSKLLGIWGAGLNLLEMLIVIALEAGEEFNSEFRPKAANETNFVFEALTRLHARACQVALEVLVLLKSGFADGAHARWRTLHEISIISCFIQQSGNQIAEQYLLHNHMESYKAANQYKDFYLRLGHDPIPAIELTQLKSVHDKLISRFGKAYSGNYGWAAPRITKLRGEVNFSDIEKAVNSGHWRPYYKLASHNVHAGPKGLYFRMGLDPATIDLFLAGPSNIGLADPAHGTAISLSQVTTYLLTIEPNVDRLVICRILFKLVDEVGNTFMEAHERVKHKDVL